MCGKARRFRLPYRPQGSVRAGASELGALLSCRGALGENGGLPEGAFSQIDRKQIRAIGITSMAEAGVAVDADGVPLTPVVPWNAGQGGPEEADFPASLRGFSLYRKTGLIWHRKYTINQLLSLKTSRPELFERMDCFLSVSDYLFSVLRENAGRRNPWPAGRCFITYLRANGTVN